MRSESGVREWGQRVSDGQRDVWRESGFPLESYIRLSYPTNVQLKSV